MEYRHPNHPGELSTDAKIAEVSREPGELNARADAIVALTHLGIPFLVGGAYAFAVYTGIYRDTKDLDLFVRKGDALSALEVLRREGWRTERTDEVWIYKAFKGQWFVDVIFNSGNGVTAVDEEWFIHAPAAEVMGQPVRLVPPEELIWSKGFVLERERYDGADVLHLLRGTAPRLDWARLIRRYHRHWEVLLSHLNLFRFAYPSERSLVPSWVMLELLSRTLDTLRQGDWKARICRGNLLSRVNYELDITRFGYLDGRRWDEAERAKEAPHGEGTGLEAPRRGGR